MTFVHSTFPNLLDDRGADRGGIQSATQEEGLFGPGVHLFAPIKLTFGANGNHYVTEYSAHVNRKIKSWW